MKKITIIFFALMMSVAGMAQADDWFEQGNAAYNNGDYEQALTLYGNIENSEQESASLYYNIGNTYYKMKEYPQAILYYEKALKLDPANEDIKTNLEIANLAVVDRITPIPQSFINRWWNGLRSWFSSDGWAWVSVAAFALLLLSLFAFLMSRRTSLRKLGFFIGLLAVLVLALSVLFAFEGRKDMKHQDEAVVITPTITVKSSPSVSSVDLFVLHEGAKVRILDAANGWNKIKIADGSVGWMQSDDMVAF